MAKAKKQGVVRDDLDQTDLIFMQLALSAIIDATRDLSPNLYRRYLTIFLDGIRADRETVTPLPVKPFTANQTHKAMTGGRHRR